MLSAVVDLLFPVHCYQCRAPLGESDLPYVCPAHAARLIPQENGEENLFCLYRYEGDLPPLLQAFKYEKKRFLIRSFNCLLEKFLRNNPLQPDVAVPVPMHPVKQKERGFNQAQLLAASAARILRIPLQNRALAKSGAAETAAQASLTRENRLNNIRGTIVPGKKGNSVEGKKVLLVDDVVTTGATSAECARILLSLGARNVTALALARTPLHLINSSN